MDYTFLVIVIFLFCMLFLTLVKGSIIIETFNSVPNTVTWDRTDFIKYQYQDIPTNLELCEIDGLDEGCVYFSKALNLNGIQTINFTGDYLNIYSSDFFSNNYDGYLQFYDFGYYFNIDNYTFIQLDLNYTSSAVNNEETEMVFLNANKDCLYYQRSSSYGFGGGVFPLEVLCSADNLSLGSAVDCGNRGVTPEATPTVLEWNLSSCNLDSQKAVRYFAILTWGQTDNKYYDFYYDYLEIDEIDISNNTLPICNFDVLESDCYNNTDDLSNIILDINLNCTDLEEETIYYSQSELDYLKRYVTQSENFNDYDFFTNGNFFSNETYTTNYEDSSEWYNYVYLGGINPEFKHIIGSINGNNILLTDNSVEVWTYNFDYAMYNSTTISMNLGFPDDKTKIDVVLYNPLNTEVLNLTFYQNGGNLSTYVNGDIKGNYETDLMNSEFENILYLTIAFNNDTLYTLVEDSRYVTFISNYTSLESAGVKGINFYSNDENSNVVDFWVLDNLLVKGWNYIPSRNFTTIVPTKTDELNYYYSKTYTIEVLVSDSAHYPTDYNTYSEDITLYKCSIKTDISQDLEDIGEGTQTVENAIISLMVDLTGQSADFWRFVFFLLWSLVCIFVSFLAWYITFYNPIIANLVFWYMELLGTILLSFPSWVTYTIIVGVTLSTAITVIKILSGGTSQNA